MKLIFSNRFQLRSGQDAPRLFVDHVQTTPEALRGSDPADFESLLAFARQREDHPLARQLLQLTGAGT